MNTNWTVGFVGDGGVTRENAAALLDDWLPSEYEEVDLQILLPKVKRLEAQNMWKVHQIFQEWEQDVSVLTDPESVLTQLVLDKDDGRAVHLITLGDADEDAVATAHKNSIPVYDLCSGLIGVDPPGAGGFDIFLPVEDPDHVYGVPRNGPPGSVITAAIESELHDVRIPEEPIRGEPGPETILLEIDGPATVVQIPEQLREDEVSGYGLVLEATIRHIVREELNKMYPGVHAHMQTQDQGQQAEAEPEWIKVWANTEGTSYKLPERDGKAPRGWRSVTITRTEAKDRGLI
jgi:hypothetical protein